MATRTGVQTPKASEVSREASGYVVPLIHTRLPEPVVNLGFYGLLTGTVVLGAVDVPLAILVGLGVAVARHRRHR
ncbi:MAG: hypothetical protein ACYCV7_05730 [Acidimicrobiales bacterium]